VALAGRVLQPHLVRSTPWPRRGHGARPHHRDWMVLNTELSPATIHRYLDTADPFDEIRLRLFSHGVEPVACRPSVSGAQSSSGWEGRKLPRRRRAGVPHATSPPWPATTRPSPGSAIATHAGFALAQGADASWIGRECYAVDRKGQLRHLSRYRTDASRPGPGPLVHECSLPPSLVARLWAKELTAHLWTPVEPGLPPAHQLPKEPKAPAVLPASSCPAPPAHGCRPAAGAGSPGSSAGYRR
jgi:hypothetical protein